MSGHPFGPEQRIDVQVGNKLRELREGRGEELITIAQVLETSLPDYIEIESGVRRASPDVLSRAARHFGISVAHFLIGLSYDVAVPDRGGAVDFTRERAARRKRSTSEGSQGCL